MNLIEQIRSEALQLGFDLAGIAPISPVPHVDAYRDWIAHGYHGEMGYMARPDRVERRDNPGVILPGARAIVCVGLNYYPGPLPGDLARDASRGLIANYAWGIDYHDLMRPRLEELAAFIRAQTGGNATTRVYVDTGPILERAYAAAAGLGFIGKNTCLIHPRMGSWLFLGEIIIDAELAPTGALIAPYILDARRCISYLTIELKGSIPRDLRPLMGNRIYGCDACQQVCPWQRFASPTRERSFHTEEINRAAPPLAELVEMDEAAFQQRYAESPVARIRRGRLLRNATVALGNWGDERAIKPLSKALQDADPLVRGHAVWALGRTGGHQVLQDALQKETDADVRQEIEMTLKMETDK